MDYSRTLFLDEVHIYIFVDLTPRWAIDQSGTFSWEGQRKMTSRIDPTEDGPSRERYRSVDFGFPTCPPLVCSLE